MYSFDNRHKFAVPYWANPRLRFMAKPAESEGGGGDDEDDEDDELDDDEDDAELAGLSADELRTRLKANQKAIEKANDRSARRRTLLKQERETRTELEKKLAAAGKTPAPKDDDGKAAEPKVDLDSIRAEAKAEGLKEGEATIKLASTRAAVKVMLPAGVKPERVDKIMRLIDFDELTVTKSGDVDGLDEAIEDAKTEFPELFAVPTKRRRSISGNVEGAEGKGGDSKTGREGMSVSEKQAAKILGRG